MQLTVLANGKQQRWHGTLKRECIRPHLPLSLEDARRLVAQFVEHYHSTRLHSAIGYVAPLHKLIGLEKVVAADRDAKLEAARERRRLARQAARSSANPNSTPLDTTAAHSPMNPKVTTAQTTPAKRRHAPGWVDFRELRRHVSFQTVLEALDFAQAFRGTGPQRRGPCPLHDTPQSRRECCSVNLHKNLFQCFHPQCQAAGNVLDFWAALQKLPIVEAARQLRDRFAPHLAPPPGKEMRQPVVSTPLPSEPFTV